MMDIQYKEAKPEESKLLIQIYNQAFYQDFLRFGECPAYGHDIKQMEDSIRRYPKNIIYCDDRPVGCISMEDRGNGNYYIGCLCLIPEYQGKGIGSYTISYLDVLVPDWRTITLHTPSQKEENVSFYIQKCGFKINGEKMDGNVHVYSFFKKRDLSWEVQLQKVAKSYDKGVEYGKNGIDLYDSLPLTIKNDRRYALFDEMQKSRTYCDSDRKEIYSFLEPRVGKKLIDLGCCLNLMFRGYDKWESLYYGVDISSDTIRLLEWYVEKNKLTIGGLYCTSMHNTPFGENSFEIGTCIGSLEYFERDFVELAIKEFARIMKSGGKFVLDIPNVGHPLSEICAKVEASMGRSDLFRMDKKDFELILESYFEIRRTEEVAGMLEYFLVCK